VPEIITRICTLIIDTNILLALPRVDTVAWNVSDNEIQAEITVCILESVMDELYGLARDRLDIGKAAAAHQVYTHLLHLQRRAVASSISLPSGACLRFVDVPSAIHQPLDPENVDHQQIAFAQEQLQRVGDLFCAIVTRDQEMADVASAAQLQTAHSPIYIIAPGGGDLIEAIRQRFCRLLAWDTRTRGSKKVPPAEPSLKVRQPTLHQPPDTRTILRRVVRSLYSRIRAARHRAILTVAPLEIRLALTAHLALLLTGDKQRVLMLFVANERAALWWAEELRRRCALPGGSVLVFGSESITRLGHARVIIYRYDQIERRFDHHAARFQKAGRRTTAVVDQCDLVDPVVIAMLLLRSDQFIGFSQHPPGHTQAIGGRMLDAFFQDESIATYTFRDGNQDGWLQDFDLHRRPVLLDKEELDEYQRVTDEFLTLHGLISRQHPELRHVADFWQGLLQILGRTVDYKAANLFVLRERREAMAQLAAAKLAMVLQLLAEEGESARCLIFDYEQLWSKVLFRNLSELGRAVAVANHSFDAAQWETTWRNFESHKLDCLVLQGVPPPGLVPANIRRLVLLTPLTPLATLSAMTDWALSHTAGGRVLNVDMLYTRDTPEQEALIDFADGCCGVRFEV
jgi:hypothetical protein